MGSYLLLLRPPVAIVNCNGSQGDKESVSDRFLTTGVDILAIFDYYPWRIVGLPRY